MGMVMMYEFLSDAKLERIKKFDPKKNDFFSDVIGADEDEGEELSTDLDKMWDALHFVFTGKCAVEEVDVSQDALNEAICGTYAIEGLDQYFAFVEKTRVSDIISALENFDMDQAMNKLDIKKFKKAGVYPDIWDDDSEEDIEILQESLTDYFENLKDFYKDILEMEGNVLVMMC